MKKENLGVKKLSQKINEI